MMSLVITALLLFLCSSSSLAGPDRIVLDDFDDGIDAAWQDKSFDGVTKYRFVEEAPGGVLRAESDASASGLIYEIEYDPVEYPVLSWRWKIDHTIAKGDASQKATDDYAARLYVIFPHWLFFKTRTLNYIWANRLPQGEIVPNSYTSNAMMVAVQSGDENAGTWITERRNIIDDYRQTFGEDPPKVGAIAIMTDTDNTGEKAVAWYDEIVISTK